MYLVLLLLLLAVELLKHALQSVKQLVWAESTHVGCGVRNCGQNGGFPYGLSIVCNYGPAGNFVGKRPYTVGQAGGSGSEQNSPNPAIEPTFGQQTYKHTECDDAKEMPQPIPPPVPQPQISPLLPSVPQQSKQQQQKPAQQQTFRWPSYNYNWY